MLSQLVRVYHVPVSLALIATLPAESSSASQSIRGSLHGRVDLSRCIYREGCVEAASSYIIKAAGSGSRTIVNYNDLPEMTVDEFRAAADGLMTSSPSSDRGSGCLFHFEGRIPDITLQCIKYLRRAYPNAQISVEVEKPGRPGLRELAAEADCVFYSKSWAEAEGYTNARDLFTGETRPGARGKLLVSTWGAKGAGYYRLKMGASEKWVLEHPAWVPRRSKVVE